jgi:hypothetical protein
MDAIEKKHLKSNTLAISWTCVARAPYPQEAVNPDWLNPWPLALKFT